MFSKTLPYYKTCINPSLFSLTTIKPLHLVPTDGRKSFYGKAKVYDVGRYIYLVSYETIVAVCIDGLVCRTIDPVTDSWAFSATTNRHITAFYTRYNRE